MRSQSKALRLSYFSIFIAIDYVLGFLPFMGILFGWLIFPAVWVLSGKRYAVLFWLYTFVASAPSLFASSITESQSLANPVQSTPIYIPYLSELLKSITHQLQLVVLFVPWPLRIVYLSMFLAFFWRWYIHNQFEETKRILARVPGVIGYGVVDPKYKPLPCSIPLCGKSFRSERLLKKHLKKRHDA